MAARLTEVTELATALGVAAPDLDDALEGHPPQQLRHVAEDVWVRLQQVRATADLDASFETAFANGRAFADAADGLAGRAPRTVEWMGPHRLPGDDVIPADLRVDRVHLVSCKYLSKVLLNPGPARLFDRLLVGEDRSVDNWYASTAPAAFQSLYASARIEAGDFSLPLDVRDLDRPQQRALRDTLRARSWPDRLQQHWHELCAEVAVESARRWNAALVNDRVRLRMLWRLLRISDVSYVVLGTDRRNWLRLRVDSAWDWSQRFGLRCFAVEARPAGQPEVSWRAEVVDRRDGSDRVVDGHVEVRWSHGRFNGAPEAKVYLDTPLAEVPGYDDLV